MNIDKVTSSMAEHGFYQFYRSFMEFRFKYDGEKIRLASRIIDEIDSLDSITIEQLRKPIIIVLYLNGISTIIFIAEFLIFNRLKWRNRKHSNIEIYDMLFKQLK